MAMSSIRQLRSRTSPAADAPYRSGGPDDPTATDPLGIGATARGMYAASTGDWPLLGPLPDPRWVGYFQTLQDRGVDHLRAVGGGPSGTAGDALADVAASMSGQPGSIEALRAATGARPAAKAPQIVRPPGAAGPGLNRVQAGMVPGSLAALRRRTGRSPDDE